MLSTSEPDVDGPDELRDLIRNILGSIAAYERAVIRGRMMAGRRAKAAEGRYIGGIPRFGYSTVDGELVADERAGRGDSDARVEGAGLLTPCHCSAAQR